MAHRKTRMALLAALLAAPVLAAPVPPEAFVRAHGIAVGAGDSVPDRAEAAAIDRIADGARVIGIGEPVHGGHEPLVQRNRLIKYLVARRGFAIVALESGLAQGRRIDAWVQGGPGDIIAIARDGLSWQFGYLQANIDLLRWLRGWNADPAHKKVHFLGADVSGGTGVTGMADARLPVDDVIAYLARALPAQSTDLRARLATAAPLFSNTAWRAGAPAAQAAAVQALTDADALLKAQKSAAVAASSADAWDWAVREVYDAQQAAAMLAVWPAPDDKSMAGWVALSQIRDRGMADHLLWALGRAPAGTQAVTFAANGHVASDQLVPVKGFEGVDWGNSYGMNLRAALGPAYRVILQVSPGITPGVKGDDLPGAVDTLLLTAGKPRLLVDIRGAGGWWAQPQTVRAHYSGLAQTVPVRAADALQLIDRLHCEPLVGSIVNECAKP